MTFAADGGWFAGVFSATVYWAVSQESPDVPPFEFAPNPATLKVAVPVPAPGAVHCRPQERMPEL